MADLKSVAEHPSFYNMGWEERRKALDAVSPEFHGITPAEQNKFIGGLTLEWIAKQEAQRQQNTPRDEDPGFWNTLGPAITGAPKAFMDFVTSHPLDQMLQRNEAIRQKSREAMARGDYSTATGLNLAGMIPGSGDQAIQAGEDFGKGHWRAGSANALMALAPFLPWGKAVPSARTIVGAKGGLQGAWDAATETVPVSRNGVTVPVPMVGITGAAGNVAARGVGLPPTWGTAVGVAAPIVRGAIKSGKAALAADAMRTARLAAGESPKVIPPMTAPPAPFPSIPPETPGQTPFRTVYPQPAGPPRVSLPSQVGTGPTPRPVTDFSPIPPETPGQMPSGRVVGTGQPKLPEPPEPIVRPDIGLGKTPNPVIQMAPLPEGGVQFQPRKVRPGVELPEPKVKISDAAAEAEIARRELAAGQPEPRPVANPRTGNTIEIQPNQRIRDITPEQANPAATPLPEQITPPPGVATGGTASASHFGDLLDSMFDEPKPGEGGAGAGTGEGTGVGGETIEPQQQAPSVASEKAPGIPPMPPATAAEQAGRRLAPGELAYKPLEYIPERYNEFLKEHGEHYIKAAFNKDTDIAFHLIKNKVTPEMWESMNEAQKNGWIDSVNDFNKQMGKKGRGYDQLGKGGVRARKIVQGDTFIHQMLKDILGQRLGEEGSTLPGARLREAPPGYLSKAPKGVFR